MADEIQEYIKRLQHQDFTLKRIALWCERLTDARLSQLIDCLLLYPDVVTNVNLGGNRLTDETGVKLARYVAASSTVRYLSLHNNQLGPATYLAVAAALRVNTSLRYLHLFGNQAEDESRIDAALVSALRVNRSRPADSEWYLYSFQFCGVDFERLQDEAKQQGHPTLQMILNNHLELISIRSTQR